jgi:hypothetical protein
MNSKPKAGVITVASLAVSIFLSISAVKADDAVELKPQAPQIDTANPAKETSPELTTAGNGGLNDSESNDAATNKSGSNDSESSNSKLHKLQVSKKARLEGDADDGQSSILQVGQGPLIMKQIYIRTNTFTMHATTPSTVITDPFTLMRAMLGTRSKDYEKLYAERDTGYGVCGFLMNIPTLRRGYAVILKCFPSMPAAQADLHPGDLITAVNGQSTLELPPKEVWDYFTGMPGTEVKIDVLRKDQPISVTLRRMDIGRIPDFGTRAEFLTLYRQNGMSKFVQR